MADMCNSYVEIRRCSDHRPAGYWVLPGEALQDGRVFKYGEDCYYIPYYAEPSEPGEILAPSDLDYAVECGDCLRMYKLTACDGGGTLGTAQDYSAYVGRVVRLADGRCYAVSDATTPIAEDDPVLDADFADCEACGSDPCVDGLCLRLVESISAVSFISTGCDVSLGIDTASGILAFTNNTCSPVEYGISGVCGNSIEVPPCAHWCS